MEGASAARPLVWRRHLQRQAWNALHLGCRPKNAANAAAATAGHLLSPRLQCISTSKDKEATRYSQSTEVRLLPSLQAPADKGHRY